MTARSFDALIKEIECNLPKEIDENIMGDKTHVVNKYFTARAGLMYRAYELALAAHGCVKNNQIAASITLTRALFETVSVVGYLNYKVDTFNKNKDLETFNETIMKVMLGSRSEGVPYSSINILSMIERIDKIMPGYKMTYGNLSEYSHPNFAGTCGLYGELKKSKMTVFSKLNSDTVKYKSKTIDQICLALDTLKYFHIDMQEKIDNFCANAEKCGTEKCDSSKA